MEENKKLNANALNESELNANALNETELGDVDGGIQSEPQNEKLMSGEPNKDGGGMSIHFNGGPTLC